MRVKGLHYQILGDVAEIEKWAVLEESEVIKMQLVSQFRCNGSDGYLAWLDQALEIRETAIMILTELITIFAFVIHLQKWKQLCLKRIASEIEQEFSQVIVGTGRRRTRNNNKFP